MNNSVPNCVFKYNLLIFKMESFIQNMLSSSSSEEDSDIEELSFLNYVDEKQPTKKAKIENFVENVVSIYSDIDFQSHFRLSRITFEDLLNVIGEKYNSIYGKRKAVYPLKDSLLLTLWTLATPESFRSIGDRFGVHKAYAHRICMRTCKLINSHINKYIVWPSTHEQYRKNVDEFNTLRGRDSFPGVLGCIDGTHIKINGNITDNSYYNRKGFHSINMLAICNAKQEFMYVFAGWPGSSADARVWSNSSIYENLQSGEIRFPENSYLLGDSGFPLSTNLIVPFRDNGHLTRAQKSFNQRLSSTRVVIEQAFGRLKGQWRRVKHIETSCVSIASQMIITSCILHNICVKNGLEDVDSGTEEEDANDDNSCYSNIPNEAKVFRNHLLKKIIK